MEDVRGYWILRVSLSPTIRYVDRNCAFATFDRVLLQVWRGAVTPQGVQELLSVGQLLVREQGSAVCSSLSVVESVSPRTPISLQPLRSSLFLVGAARAAPLGRSEFGRASPHAATLDVANS